MGLDVFGAYATDLKAEVEGVVIPLAKGATIKVARENNDRYLSRIMEESEANRAILDAGGVAATELDKRVTTQILAETVFLGFTGLDYKGVAQKDTPESRIKFLEIKDFRAKVMVEARKQANYRAKVEAKDASD